MNHKYYIIDGTDTLYMLVGGPWQYWSLVCENTDQCWKQRKQGREDQLAVVVQHCFKPVHTQTRTISPDPLYTNCGHTAGRPCAPQCLHNLHNAPSVGRRGQYRGDTSSWPDLPAPEPAFTVSAITIKLPAIVSKFCPGVCKTCLTNIKGNVMAGNRLKLSMKVFVQSF